MYRVIGWNPKNQQRVSLAADSRTMAELRERLLVESGWDTHIVSPEA
jgi:hypothetical protein